MVLEQAFNGAGDTWTPTWINLGVYWVLQIPLAWLLASRLEMGADGVFVAVSIAYSMLAVVSAVLFKRGRWKLKHV
ncbi:multidrug efflux protein NorA [compost metagenome]